MINNHLQNVPNNHVFIANCRYHFQQAGFAATVSADDSNATAIRDLTAKVLKAGFVGKRQIEVSNLDGFMRHDVLFLVNYMHIMDVLC